jgi:hypothetical protein
MPKCNAGWDRILAAVQALTEADLARTVYLYDQGPTVTEALGRQMDRRTDGPL